MSETILHITTAGAWERATDVGEDFPHIYGPLDLDAVVRVVPMPEGPDGYAPPPGEGRSGAGAN